MAPSQLSSFTTPAFAVLFLYCCFLQYQLLQLSYLVPQSQGGAATSELRGSADSHPSHSIAWEVQHNKSPPPQSPSSLTDEEERRVERSFYGGKKDPVHLGGFTVRDNDTISYNLWNYMMSEWAVKSVVDVGCGKGFSSRHFLDNGVHVLCVEGSRDAVEQSVLPRDVIVNHDFSLGPWWPEQTYDVAWSTEFVEHVGRPFMKNYLPIFHKAAIIMITSSGWGGWHHVEVHGPWWWRSRMQAQGFIFSRDLTEMVAHHVGIERDLAGGHGGQQLGGMLVFINPAVAALPKHRHLIGGHGCYGNTIDNQDGGAECTGKDRLPQEFQSLVNCRRDPKDLPNGAWRCKRNPSHA